MNKLAQGMDCENQYQRKVILIPNGLKQQSFLNRKSQSTEDIGKEMDENTYPTSWTSSNKDQSISSRKELVSNLPQNPSIDTTAYHQNIIVFSLISLQQQTAKLAAKLDELEKKLNKYQVNPTQIEQESINKRIRRKSNQITKNHLCPHAECKKQYGSQVSLNQHLKNKHNQKLGFSRCVDRTKQYLNNQLKQS